MISSRLLSSVLALALAASMSACEDANPIGPGPAPDLEVSQAPPSQEMKPVPFHGSTTGMLVGMAPAETGRCPLDHPVLFSYQGQGKATHLGLFTVEGGECVNPMTMTTRDARFVFTAANGDKLYVAYNAPTVTFDPPPSPWMRWSATPSLTGGTGRFEGAEFVDVTWSGGGNLATGEMYSNLDGWIRYDASRRRMD